MKYPTNTIRRGLNRALKILKIINQDKKIETINQQLDIERNLIEQNKAHHQKVFETKAYKDKLYKQLLIDDTRNKILNRILTREECNDNDIFEFMNLLKILN